MTCTLNGALILDTHSHWIDTMSVNLGKDVIVLSNIQSLNKHLTLNGLQSFIWDQQPWQLKNNFQTKVLNLTNTKQKAAIGMLGLCSLPTVLSHK